MSRESRKGNGFAEDVANYLASRLGDGRIERRVLHGTKDRGDIAGLLFRGRKVAVECKNCKDMRLSTWVDEVEEERGNDDAEFGIVIHKRKGRGAKRFGENYVTMTLETYCAMTAGSHWHLNFDAVERGNSRVMAAERGIDECG